MSREMPKSAAAPITNAIKGCFNLGLLAILLLLGIPTLCHLGKAYYEYRVEVTDKNRALSRMFRLAAFVQQERRQGSKVKWENYYAYMSQSPGTYFRLDDISSIGCYEIPEAERTGRLKGMEFYVYDSALKMGVLANGLPFEKEHGPGLLASLQAADLR